MREALQVSKGSEITLVPVLEESVLSTISCREMQTPGNIQQLILQVAWYELVSKPLGALYHGVPTEYHSSGFLTCMICTGPPQDR